MQGFFLRGWCQTLHLECPCTSLGQGDKNKKHPRLTSQRVSEVFAFRLCNFHQCVRKSVQGAQLMTAPWQPVTRHRTEDLRLMWDCATSTFVSHLGFHMRKKTKRADNWAQTMSIYLYWRSSKGTGHFIHLASKIEISTLLTVSWGQSLCCVSSRPLPT